VLEGVPLAELVGGPALDSAQVVSRISKWPYSADGWRLVSMVADNVCHSCSSSQLLSHSSRGCHWLGCLLSLSVHLHRTALKLLAFASQFSISADCWQMMSMVDDDVCHSCSSSQLLFHSLRSCHSLGCLLSLSPHIQSIICLQTLAHAPSAGASATHYVTCD